MSDRTTVITEARPVPEWTDSDDELPGSPRPGDLGPEPLDSRRVGSARIVHLPAVPARKALALGLIGIGGLLAAFLVYLFAFTPLTASRNQARLAQAVSEQTIFRYSLASGRVPTEGSPVAVLTIPSLGVHQLVVEGTSASDLMMGPGLLPGSSLPGSPGNAVIAGRRVTFGAPFRSLGQLRPGNRIEVVDGVGRFAYQVTSIRTVTAGEPDVVTPTTDNRITLITSGSSVTADDRLAVVAKLVGRPYAVPPAPAAIPTYELGLSGDPAAGGLTVIWSFLTMVVILGAGYVAWRSRRLWLVYLFAAPVVIACGLFACESLARALPATY